MSDKDRAMDSVPNTPLPDDDWLDQALRADAAGQDYLPDDGFTARVMGTLPPPVPAMPKWRRPVLGAMWGIAGAAAIASLPNAAFGIAGETALLLSSQPVSLAQVGIALAAMVVATWGAAAYTLRD